jgi:hypothetical protein
MKYYTFTLDWTNPKEGTNPSTIVNVDGVRLEPSFCVGTEPNATHYAYLISGQLELDKLTQWQLTEVTLEDTLTAAQTINPDAYLVEGKIYFPAGDAFALS